MRKFTVLNLAIWALVAADLRAQETLPVPVSEAIVVPGDVGPVVAIVPAEPERNAVWVDGDLLLWWVKGSPLPPPIVQVTGGGSTSTAFGQTPTNFGAISGLRISLGVYFDEFNNYGFETSLFTLGRNRERRSIYSDGDGSPSIALSYRSATPRQPGEYVFRVAEPGIFAGGVLAMSTLELWGAEFNGSICLLRAGGLEFTTLFGFRYLDLRENLFLSTGSTDLATGDFLGFEDSFSTRNEFSGGQLGARVNWTRGRMSLSATGKVALGATRQVVDVRGDSFDSTTGFYPVGFYVQGSNSGRTTATQFSVVPSLDLKLGYQVFHCLKLVVGYDFLYWSNVVRPGNQLDRNINLSQNPILGTGVLVGAGSPAPLFNRSDFWAQGMTFGLEFRF